MHFCIIQFPVLLTPSQFKHECNENYLYFRLHLNESNALHSLDEATLISEIENQDSHVARQWSSLLGTNAPVNKDSLPYRLEL